VIAKLEEEIQTLKRKNQYLPVETLQFTSGEEVISFALDAKANIYTLTPGGVDVYSVEEGEPIRTIELATRGSRWRHLAVSPDGDIFFVGSQDQVQVLNAEGKLLREIRDCQWPVGIASDGKGSIFLANARGLHVFDLQGQPVRTINIPGGSPQAVAVDSAGNIYVPYQRGSDRVVDVLDGQGRVQRSFAVGPLSYSAASIAVSSKGNIFMVEPQPLGGRQHHPSVEVFDEHGNDLHGFGGQGSGPGQFQGPRVIALDGDDNVYVLDHLRIQTFTHTDF
jgi:sugar lactone lactonase YvrE